MATDVLPAIAGLERIILELSNGLRSYVANIQRWTKNATENLYQMRQMVQNDTNDTGTF